MEFLYEANKGVQAIIIVLVFYLLYYISGYSSWFKGFIGINEKPVLKIIYQKLNGGLILGGLSVLYIIFVLDDPLKNYGLNFDNLKLTAILVVLFGLPAWIVSRFYSVKPSNLKVYPEIRVLNWDLRLFFLSSGSWAFYLLGYELMFRGFLLFACLLVFDVYTSVIINSLLYALVHIHKGWVETFASFPMGILLCTLAILTGNIWVPFLVHLTLAVSNDFYAIKANKKFVMRF